MPKFITAQEIDGHKGIKSPHARELESLGQQKAEIFTNQKKRRIKILVEDFFNGRLETLGLGEDYTLTFPIFPEVNIHILYTKFEEEEDEPFGEAELRFLFSGQRVSWVPTEDLVGLIEAILEFLEALLSEDPINFPLPPTPTPLLQQALQERHPPFEYLTFNHLEDLAKFVGGVSTSTKKSWMLSKSFFQGVNVTLHYRSSPNDFFLTYNGENITKISNYARDQLGIFLLNHCIRFISVTYPAIKMPPIVGRMFSYSYLKKYSSVKD
ncbi:MAG: hypothetical protein ACTSRS_16460 [Candidatus Helarchaeota archaeon]